MKSLSTLSLLFLLPFALFAQEMDPKEKAKNILEKVSSRYEGYKSIKANFKYIMENRKRDDFKEAQSGTIELKGEKFRLDLGNYLVICNNKDVWTYLKDANEVQVNKYEPGEMKINPKEMFTIYQKGYLYGYKGRKEVEGTSYHVIELTPEDKEQSLYKSRLLVHPENYRIMRMKAFEQDGSIFTYKINDYQLNKDMPASNFQFEKTDYPDVTVVDLRK